MKKKSTVVVYATLPDYRADFFNLLNQKLGLHHNKQLVVLAGTNLGTKVVKEIESDISFSLIRNHRVGTSFLGYQIQWQKGLIKSFLKLDVSEVIIMYNFGVINYSILIMLCYIKRIPVFIWGSGHRRTGLSDGQFKIKTVLKSIFFSLVKGHITYGSNYAEYLIRNNISNNVTCAQNTIDVERIIKKTSHISRVFNPSNIKFLTVGNLIYDKRVDKVLYAIASLKSRGFNNFTYDIIGDGIDKTRLETIVSTLKIEDSVNFHGAKFGSEVEVDFVNANVFILPGTGGLAVNEALAYGLPVISTPGDGTLDDLIVEFNNGFLLEFEYEIKELEDKMKYFLTISELDYKKFNTQSVDIVSNRASLNNMAEKFIVAISSDN